MPYPFYAWNAPFQTLNLAAWAVIQSLRYVELRD